MKSRQTAAGVSVHTLLAAFPNERACLDYVFYTRHQLRPNCPLCGKPARFRPLFSRRSFISGCCSAIVSPTAGSILDYTRLPLRMWFYAILLMSSLGVGISQNALCRQIGITRKAGWLLADKIRTHMALSLPDEPLGLDGRTVCVDEAKVHIGPRQRLTSLFGMSDRVRCKIWVVRDRSAKSLVPLIVENVVPGARVVSDGWPAYKSLRRLGFDHSPVVHSRHIWTNAAGESTASIEWIWASTRYLLRGKKAQVTDAGLWKHLAEVMHRYNAGLDPAAAYWELIGSFRTIGAEDIERARRSIDRR